MITQNISHERNEFHAVFARFSHEIRNPLTLIDSELQLLAASYPHITEHKDWEIIQNNLEYIKDLLQDFSVYSSAIELSPVSTSPSEYFTHLLRTVQPTMEYLNIRLTSDIPGNLPVFLLDQHKLRQAFLNVIRNAQEAIHGPGGHIHVAVSLTPGQELCISISDNGCGISESQLQNIFTPFVTYKPQGNGLGLPITSQIIQAHGGTINVDSKPGHGTTFSFFLK